MSESTREQKALARWRPGRRWYHPLIARLTIRLSALIMTRLNSLEIEGLERFESLRDRGGRGLLTYCNHVALFDDPLLPSHFNVGPWEGIRWVATDAINFFDSPPKAWLFTVGKGVPIMRGSGVEQPGMLFLRDRLREGAWVHIFAEGGRTRDPDALMAASFKSGIGWLIAEAHPILLPFYHHGMHEVLPVGAKWPRRGKNVRLVFGEPIDCDEAYVAAAAPEAADPSEALAARAHAALRALEARVHPLAAVPR